MKHVWKKKFKSYKNQKETTIRQRKHFIIKIMSKKKIYFRNPSETIGNSFNTKY